jgi:uncharacterized membrane protein
MFPLPLLPVLDHPLHPFTVHFPIAFYLLGVLLTLIYLGRGQAEVERFAFWSFGLSWIAAIVASVVGLIDQNQLAQDDPRRNTVNAHITAAVALLIINGLLLYFRFRWLKKELAGLKNLPALHLGLYLGLMALGVAAVLITAWLGGELVYRLRVGIL